MKKYIKNILKRSSINIIAIIIALGTAITYASIASINWPTTTPNGEVEGGKFMVLFNKILSSCPDGQAIKGYAPNGDKICMDLDLGGLGISGSGNLSFERVSTGWGPISNGSTLNINCPENSVGVTCNFDYYDNNGGVTYHGYGIGNWNNDRTICSKTVNDTGMTEGRLIAECSSGGIIGGTSITQDSISQLTESCPVGEALQGYSSTGSAICVPLTVPTPVVINPTIPTNTGTLDEVTQSIVDFYAGTIDEAGPSCEPGVLTERCYHLRLAGKTFKFIQTINGFHQDYTITYYTQFSKDGYYVYNGKAYNPPREDEAEQQEIKYLKPPVVNYYTQKAIEDAGFQVASAYGTLVGYPALYGTDMIGNKIDTSLSNYIIPIYSYHTLTNIGGFLCYHPSKATSYMDYTTNEGKLGYFMGGVRLKGDPFSDNLQYWDPNSTSYKDLKDVNEVTYISPYACSDENSPYLAP